MPTCLHFKFAQQSDQWSPVMYHSAFDWFQFPNTPGAELHLHVAGAHVCCARKAEDMKAAQPTVDIDW